MKQIFTLFTAIAVLFTVQATAQNFTENFDGSTALTRLQSNCWLINGMTAEAAKPTGKGITLESLASAGASNSSFGTPYFDFVSGSTVNVSFQITIDKPLANQANRTVSIGLLDKNNNFVSYSSSPYTKTTLKTSDLFTLSTSINTSGTFRVFVNITADNGDGNTHIIVDNFQITNAPAYHYGSSPCNSVPTAGNDNFATLTSTPYSNNVLGNDSDPNAGETISASIVSQPLATIGTVSLSSNGNFTFTPAVGFAGGPVTFTYKVTDNGYDPVSSNTATVTIIYPEAAVLPVQLVSFSGSLVSNKAQLRWLVEENETGSYFEIEKSTNGKSFSSIGVVMISEKAGSESYTYTEASELSGDAYYRIKIVNKNNSTSQSRTIVLKSQKSSVSNSLQVMQNPVEASLSFNYTATKAGVSMVNIYNMTGVKVYSTNVNAQAGINALSFSVDNKLSSGTYVLEVVNGLERSVSKIIKK